MESTSHVLSFWMVFFYLVTTDRIFGISLFVCMATHIARVWINRVRLPILLVVSRKGKINISLSAFAPENLVSRDGFGSPVSRQPAHLHTQAKYGAYLRDSSRVPRRRPSIYLKPPYAIGSVPTYRVAQLRTDGVHCRESAGTGPVNLKVGSGHVESTLCENSINQRKQVMRRFSRNHTNK